jgi:arginyl-tRNA synthetase
MRSPDTHMDFDLDLAKEQSDKNPVYYAQYAYARICSILRKSTFSKTAPSIVEGSTLLSHPSELALIKQLIRLPEIIADTARDYQVHRLPQYVLELVRSFHKFYEDCRVLSTLSDLPRAESRGVEGSGANEVDEVTSTARLALCEATKIVLKNTFDLMGISAPEKM